MNIVKVLLLSRLLQILISLFFIINTNMCVYIYTLLFEIKHMPEYTMNIKRILFQQKKKKLTKIMMKAHSNY